MIPQDYHLHTTFSCDAKSSMVEMCHAAIASGLQEIGFSEHYDLNPLDTCYDWFMYDAWYAEIEQCRNLFNDKLAIRAGVEFSEPHLYPQGVLNLLNRLPFDYVIGSLHYIGTELIFSEEYFRRRTTNQAFQDYFTELEVMTRLGNFDVLGHIDVLTLTAKLFYDKFDPPDYEAITRRVLQNCIERDIVLEINTQGLRKPAQLLVPGDDILRWYVEMGGKNICLGSDAHLSNQVGLNLEDALRTAYEAGLATLTFFDKRKKRQVTLNGFILSS